MKYICAWCKKLLPDYPESDSELESHGICEECALKEFGVVPS